MKTHSAELLWKSDSQLATSLRLHPRLMKFFQSTGPNLHINLPIGLRIQALAQISYYVDLYKKVLDAPSVVCEFGVKWGGVLTTIFNLRAVLEPFNRSQTIGGFYSFSRFLAVDPTDGDQWKKGDFSSKSGFKDEFDFLLKLHEAAAPMADLKKYDLVQGNTSITFPRWLDESPHAIVSVAIFDAGLYKPYLDVLNIIVSLLTKDSILVFDELSCKYFPGETVALREALGTENLRLRRSTLQL